MTRAADVYSLGKTLESIMSGSIPGAMGPSGPLPRTPALSEDLWSRLDSVLGKACAYDPQERFQTVDEFLEALPVPVLAAASSTQEPNIVAGDVTLEPAAVFVLSKIIAACPNAHDRASTHGLERGSKISDYDFAMALRSLADARFIEHEVVDDFNGEWHGVFPGDAGFQWMRTHAEEVNAAVEAFEDKPSEEHSSSLLDVLGEDIPF